MFKFSSRQKVALILGFVFFVVFIGFTLVVAFVDVDQVGLSHINQFFWQHCGQHPFWVSMTKWLGYGLILILVGLVGLQIWQWVQRKGLRKIDVNLLWLDAVCVALVLVYLFFEIVVINYRPLLENGVAKASYPSSHAMLFATMIPLLIGQVWFYLKNQPLRVCLTVVLGALLVIGIVGRMYSGVHWFTDIVGGVLISCSMICFYCAFVKLKHNQER